MRRLAFIMSLAFLAVPALAQQPDPAQALAKEWATLQAADTLAASAHEHVAELAQKLVAAHQQQRQQFDQAKAELDYWHRWCGDKPGCVRPE